ncbi:uncharacterized protein LOC141917392 [Strix aluco]|uniref:uncharacterized protein LOC141917392 n=1 Tax=Strix aluco TaxID=111821 RepID=UPI003DA309AF
MSSPDVAWAKAVLDRAMGALVGLAEALGTPGLVTKALAEAKAVLEDAEEARERLNTVLVETMAAAAPVIPTPGVNAEGVYGALEALATARAAELERELRQNRRRRRVLRVIRDVAIVLMLVCTPLLSLDVVREALGVTQENELVTSLATIIVTARRPCTARRQPSVTWPLPSATNVNKLTATRHRARAIAAVTKATAEATTAFSDTLGTLEEVTRQLRTLVDAVTQDLEMDQGFPASAQALGTSWWPWRQRWGTRRGHRGWPGHGRLCQGMSRDRDTGRVLLILGTP